jgi:hypothetical protein
MVLEQVCGVDGTNRTLWQLSVPLIPNTQLGRGA